MSEDDRAFTLPDSQTAVAKRLATTNKVTSGRFALVTVQLGLATMANTFAIQAILKNDHEEAKRQVDKVSGHMSRMTYLLTAKSEEIQAALEEDMIRALLAGQEGG